MRCQICGKPTETNLDKNYEYKTESFERSFPDLRVGYCDICKLYQVEVPDSEENREKLFHYYENEYRKGRIPPDLNCVANDIRGGGILLLIKKYLLTCEKCFEKGAGYGSNLMAIQKEYPGAKLYTDEMDKHTESYLVGVEKRDLEIPEKYDVIIMSHVFEHLANCNETISLCANRLRTGGILYIQVPNSLEFVEPHITFWTPVALRRYYEAYLTEQFELCELVTTGFPHYFRSTLTKVLAKVARRIIFIFMKDKEDKGLVKTRFPNGVYLHMLLKKK